MIEYLAKHPDKILNPFVSHMKLVIITLLISVAAAIILTVISVVIQKIGDVFLNVFSVIYSIPSLALFAILIPLTGLGFNTAVIVLVLYNQYLLLRNFLVGINEVDPAVLEAAKGIGMKPLEILWMIQAPLARKAIFAGIRLAIVSTIGIGTIASSINAGGLGDLLFDGLRTMNSVKILWGSILSAFLAVSINYILKLLEEFLGGTYVVKND